MNDPHHKMNGWKEYIENLLNQESVIHQMVYNLLEQAGINEEHGSL